MAADFQPTTLPIKPGDFLPADLPMCESWATRMAPAIAALAGQRVSLSDALEVIMALDLHEELRGNGVAWLLAHTAHMIDRDTYVQAVVEARDRWPVVARTVTISSTAQNEDFDTPLVIFAGWRPVSLWLELSPDEHAIIFDGPVLINIEGPAEGEAFVQLVGYANQPEVLTIEAGNVSVTHDAKTWSGTNPLIGD